MVVIAARAPTLFRKIQYAFSGGTKRKRDEPSHAAPQPSSEMSPPLRVGMNLFNKRPRTQGCLDDEVRPFRSRPCFRHPCLTLACRRAVAGNCAASAAAVSAGDSPLAPTQVFQRGAEDPALFVSALQPPQLLERQAVAGDTGGTPLPGACDDTYSMLWRRAGGESLAAATAAVEQRVGARGDRRGRSVFAGRRAAAGPTRRRCSPQRSRFLRGAGGAHATADR